MTKKFGIKMFLAVALAGCGILTAGCWQAYSAENSPKSIDLDDVFAMRVAQHDLTEIRLGKLAEINSLNPTVKSFGRMMVRDHSRENTKLKKIASKDDLVLPPGTNEQARAEYQQLAKMSGPSFDRAYARAMVAYQQNNLSEFKTEANSGSVKDIKVFASRTLPGLKRQLKLAEQMEHKVAGANDKGNIG